MQKLTNSIFPRQYEISLPVYTAPENHKISAIAEIFGGVYAVVYNNDTRRNSQILWNWQPVYDGGDETIGHPLVWGNYVIAAGECGNLIYCINHNVNDLRRHIPLKWATACVKFAGYPYVLDLISGQQINVRECFGGHTIATLPGDNIAMRAVEYNGLLWAAVTSSDESEYYGLSCTDGRLIREKHCRNVCVFYSQLLYSAGNSVFRYDGHKSHWLGELPCETITDMQVITHDIQPATIRIAGGNPSSFWDVDLDGTVTPITTFKSLNAPVGGSCFRELASKNYIVRCLKGTQSIVYKTV